MNREEYLRQLDSAGDELFAKGQLLVSAANPLNQLRDEVARDWKWWLPGASVAGFAAARWFRLPRGKGVRGDMGSSGQGGAAFWVPTLLKLLPAILAQLVPVFLNFRAGRKQ